MPARAAWPHDTGGLHYCQMGRLHLHAIRISLDRDIVNLQCPQTCRRYSREERAQLDVREVKKDEVEVNHICGVERRSAMIPSRP